MPPRIPQHEGLATFFLVVGVVLFVIQFNAVRKQIDGIAHAQAPPVVFPKLWKPERTYYHPGDAVKFFFYRNTKDQKNLILFQSDAFENEDTGILYHGEILGHIAQANSIAPIQAVRFLPNRAEPGPYHLEGWVSSQTEVRSMAGIYFSERFWVVPKGETLEEYLAQRSNRPLHRKRPD